MARTQRDSTDRQPSSGKSKLRVIGGSMRGRTIEIRTTPSTRPMKDRTREAVFNLLGGKLDGYDAFDLFAGTGILGFEALSRGAHSATGIELLATAAAAIQQNCQHLGIQNYRVIRADALQWSPTPNELISKQPTTQPTTDPPRPWVIFCCPPYRLWQDRRHDLEQMILGWCDRSPAHSLLAIEGDQNTNFDFLPRSWQWDFRVYRPAVIAIGDHKAS